MFASAHSRPSPGRLWSWLGLLLAIGPDATSHSRPPSRPTPPSGAALGRIHAAPSGDFERFFRAHEPDISGYLWRMTGDEQSASDLCQETFLRAWQRFDTVRVYERPGAWLLRVATNLALQHLRRKRAPVGAATSLDETFAPATSDPGLRFAERDLVRETLLTLPPKPRAMLVLREVYGLSGDEVTDALGMSREAVKMALWRARQQFRAAYLRKDGQP